jgi:hypothetical protein
MPTSVFKGGIGTGTVSARYQPNAANTDSDLLIISFARTGGGDPDVRQAAAAPGGFARVEIDAPGEGVLEVWVSTGQAGDGGQLTTALNGTALDDEATQGSVRWVYAVGGA